MYKNGKKTVILDLTDCRYWMDFHERIRIAFDFPEYYGQNWDAFWDCLSWDCDADRVEVIGEGTMPPEYEKDFKIMHELLQMKKDEREKYGEEFEYEIIS